MGRPSEIRPRIVERLGTVPGLSSYPVTDRLNALPAAVTTFVGGSEEEGDTQYADLTWRFRVDVYVPIAQAGLLETLIPEVYAALRADPTLGDTCLRFSLEDGSDPVRLEDPERQSTPTLLKWFYVNAETEEAA